MPPTLAKTYDQLGHQAKSALWRDVYLTAAFDLHHGGPEKGMDLAKMKQVFLRSPVENFLPSMAARVIDPDAFGEHFVINIHFADLKKSFVLELKNSVLHHKKVPLAPQANPSLHLTHELFIDLVIGNTGLSEILFSDNLTLEGSKVGLVSFFALFNKPKGVFEIVNIPLEISSVFFIKIKFIQI